MAKLVVCFVIMLAALTYCQEEDELVCTGPNEIDDCRSTCELECATLDVECNIRYIQCERKCWCKENYARNDRGICIPIYRCPRRRPCSNL